MVHVAAGMATKSEAVDDVPGALDVDVTITIGGREISGGVTLVPAADGRPTFEAYGSDPGHWVAPHILRALRPLGDAQYTEALRAIEAAAAESCAAGPFSVPFVVQVDGSDSCESFSAETLADAIEKVRADYGSARGTTIFFLGRDGRVAYSRQGQGAAEGFVGSPVPEEIALALGLE